MSQQDWSSTVIIEESLPEGEYFRAECISVEGTRFTHGNVIIIEWRVSGGEHDGKYASGIASVKSVVRPGSKLYDWVTAMLGRPLQAGEQVNQDLLINTVAEIMTSRLRKKEDREFNKVMDVRAVRD